MKEWVIRLTALHRQGVGTDGLEQLFTRLIFGKVDYLTLSLQILALWGLIYFLEHQPLSMLSSGSSRHRGRATVGCSIRVFCFWSLGSLCCACKTVEIATIRKLYSEIMVHQWRHQFLTKFLSVRACYVSTRNSYRIEKKRISTERIRKVSMSNALTKVCWWALIGTPLKWCPDWRYHSVVISA